MILNRDEIDAAGIVTGAVAASKRSTTYDATIGDIIAQGEVWQGDTFLLEKRGVVWVISDEEFTFGDTNTGLATLKTSWTHKGVLALNVGIIDPGWTGPLATALVNLSRERITIKKGNPFFRVVVFNHNKATCESVTRTKEKYLEEITERSRMFAATFLDTHSLVDEVAYKVFKFPKLAVWLAMLGIVVAIVSIFAPIAISAWNDHQQEAVGRRSLEERVQQLENRRDDETPSVPNGRQRPN